MVLRLPILRPVKQIEDVLPDFGRAPGMPEFTPAASTVAGPPSPLDIVPAVSSSPFPQAGAGQLPPTGPAPYQPGYDYTGVPGQFAPLPPQQPFAPPGETFRDLLPLLGEAIKIGASIAADQFKGTVLPYLLQGQGFEQSMASARAAAPRPEPDLLSAALTFPGAAQIGAGVGAGLRLGKTIAPQALKQSGRAIEKRLGQLAAEETGAIRLGARTWEEMEKAVSQLPPVRKGLTRLFRGGRGKGEYANFTRDSESAIQFATERKGNLYYIDVPQDMVSVDDYFQDLPSAIANKAKVVERAGPMPGKLAIGAETPIEREIAGSKGITDIESKLDQMANELQRRKEYPSYLAEQPTPSIGEPGKLTLGTTSAERAATSLPASTRLSALERVKRGLPTEDFMADVQYDEYLRSLPPGVERPPTTMRIGRLEIEPGELQRIKPEGGILKPAAGAQEPLRLPPSVPPRNPRQRWALEMDSDPFKRGLADRMTNWIKQEGWIARGEQEYGYSKERAIRIATWREEIDKVMANPNATIEDIQRAKGLLKGELPKVTGLAEEFTPGDVADLMRIHQEARGSGIIKDWEQVRANDAVEKILNGRVPQQNELVLLERIYGAQISEAIAKHMPWQQQLASFANLPKAFLASVDVSAVLRQAVLYTYRHPVKAAESATEGLKALFSKASAEQLSETIRNTPYFNATKIIDNKPVQIMRKVQFGEYGPQKGLTLGNREEPFMSAIAHKVPWVRASERAYVTVLNKIRSDLFSMIAKAEETRLGVKLGEADITVYDDVADAVNILTGRGRGLEKHIPTLNAGIFAPRLHLARLETPFLLLSKNPSVRKEVAQELTAFIMTNLGILTAVKQSGIADVELDPRSTDLGKFRFGNQRIDPWGGYQQYVVMIVRLYMEQRKTQTGEITTAPKEETLARFARTKASPAAGRLVDVAMGETVVGEEFAPEAIGKRMTERIGVDYASLPPIGKEAAAAGGITWEVLAPMVVADIADALRLEGIKGLIAGPYAFFGGGVQTYEPSPMAKQKQEIAKLTGTDWDKLTLSQQIKLRETRPEIAQIEERTKLEQAKRPLESLSLLDESKIGKAMQDRLRPEISEIFAKAGKRLGGPSRSITLPNTGGKTFYLNDERYQRYQDIIIELMNQVYPKVLPDLQRIDTEKSRKVITELNSRINTAAKQQLVKEIEGVR